MSTNSEHNVPSEKEPEIQTPSTGGETDTDEARELKLSHETQGRYADLRDVGQGGVGRVTAVQDTVLDRVVARKELLPRQVPEDMDTFDAQDPERFTKGSRGRFVREAIVTAQLEHPAIVPVYDVGVRADGTPYYTMRLVRGETLQATVARTENLRDRLRLLPHFLDLCHAAAYAHDKEIIHRDIKPANIMLGGFGQTLLLDWGISKRLGPPESAKDGSEDSTPGTAAAAAEGMQTQEGQIVGTPAFLAPELQTHGSLKADKRSDVYSLGGVLYFMLTGSPPPQPDSASAAGLTFERGTPKELAAICRKALEPERMDRYADAKELATDVEAYLSGSVVASYPYTMAEWVLLSIHRRRVFSAWLAVFTATLLVVLAWAQASIMGERSRAVQENYQLSIALAESQLLIGAPWKAVQQLDSAPEKLREWEWGYLAHSADPSLYEQPATMDTIAFASYFGAERLLLTTGYSRETTVWKVPDRSPMAQLRNSAKVRCFARGHDGKVLALGHSDGLVTLADVPLIVKTTDGLLASATPV